MTAIFMMRVGRAACGVWQLSGGLRLRSAGARNQICARPSPMAAAVFYLPAAAAAAWPQGARKHGVALMFDKRDNEQR